MLCFGGSASKNPSSSTVFRNTSSSVTTRQSMSIQMLPSEVYESTEHVAGMGTGILAEKS